MTILYALVALGILLTGFGVFAYFTDRRRLSNYVLLVAGLGLTAMSGLLLLESKDILGPIPMLIVFGIVVLALLGYPLLAAFLISNGVTMWRRESRTLGNLLALLLGLAMVILPVVLVGVNNVLKNNGALLTTWLAFSIFFMGLAAYLGFCFLCFLVASFIYGKRPLRVDAKYIIILGSGIYGEKVPPLLAARLDRAIRAGVQQDQPPIYIPSGGQGAGESIPEGVAMARYLKDKGIPEEQILIEDKARNTEENLKFSQHLMDDPNTQTLVVTTGYHVFRAALLTRRAGLKAQVRGARTAFYYVPSAFLREFVAVMRMNFWLNLFLVGLWAMLMIFLVGISLNWWSVQT